MIKQTLFISLILLFGVSNTTLASDNAKPNDYMPSPITETPLEGRQLAMTIVRKTIGTIQTNPEIKHAVRKQYQDDALLLMRSAELVAIEFKTIAIANNYWRK